MTRPKSASDAHVMGRLGDVPPSPTKGILLTPGTVGGRGKTVTFGDRVADKDMKRSLDGSVKTLPESHAVKFVGPHVAVHDPLQQDGLQTEQRRGRSRLTEQLEKVREDSARRKDGHLNEANRCGGGDAAVETEEPTCTAGKYWKREYDIYRENTAREVRKLIKKQQSAKSFARDKDVQCTQLSEELSEERKKVEDLQRRTTELEARLRLLHVQTPKEESLRSAANPEDRLARASRRLLRTTARDATQVSPIRHEDKDSTKDLPRRLESRTGPQVTETKSDSDVLIHPHGTTRATDQTLSLRPGPGPSRTVTSGTDLTPLASLSVNADSVTHAAPTSTIEQRKPNPKQRHDSLDPGLALPDPVIPLQLTGTQRAPDRSPSPPIVESDPLLYQSRAPRVAPEAGQDVRPALTSRVESKENVSPTLRASVVKSAKAAFQPAAAAEGKRIVSREGVEVPADRIAAARARLDARRLQRAGS